MLLDIITFSLSSILLGALLVALISTELGLHEIAAWMGRWIIRIVSFNRIRLRPTNDTSADIVVGALTIIGLFLVAIITIP